MSSEVTPLSSRFRRTGDTARFRPDRSFPGSVP